MSDESAQIKQLEEGVRQLRTTLNSIEISGAAVPAIHAAMDCLNACELNAKHAIATKPERNPRDGNAE